MRLQPRGRTTLLELLSDAGVRVDSDCGGLGRCGKCRVVIRDAEGERRVLACRLVPKTAVDVVGVRRRARVARRPAPDGGRVLVADVGTTTVSLSVVEAGRVVVRRDLLNPQLRVGADVMTRIAAVRRTRAAGLAELLAGFASESGAARRTATVVGNTAMMHFVFGASPAGLGVHPYRSRLALGRSLAGRCAGLAVRTLPLLGSFVGSDCTAAILASGMHRRAGLELLVDAGTNGELVLGNRDRLLCCSTAAGPAFEGATLECGSLARRGAVRRVHVRRGRLVTETIGRAEPASICGSGVLDAAAAGLLLGRIDRTGRAAGGRLDVAGPVYLSQADIRDVQLAKAAVAAGIRVLLGEWGAAAADVTRVHLTGKFGAALSVESAVAIGLLPAALAGRVRQHGNLALRGAVTAARDRGSRAEAAALAGRTREVALAEHPLFEETFVGAMELVPWS